MCLIVWKTILPSVQRHSRKLYTSKSHQDKQAFAFYFHPALACPVWDVKDAGISEVHTHSTRKVQDPRSDTLVIAFKQLRQGMTGGSSKKAAVASSEANTQQRTAGQPHVHVLLLAFAISSFEHMLPVLSTMPVSHLHFVVQINQDNSFSVLFLQGWCKASYRDKSKVGRPYVSISFWFIRVVSAEQPNITDPMHSASNNLATDQICSVLHRGIEGHNSFSYKYHLYLVISVYRFKHMQRSHAYTQRLTVHRTATLLHSIWH